MSCRTRTCNPGQRPWGRSAADAAILLAGGFVGAIALSLLHVPAGALIGSVIGSMTAGRMADLLGRTRATVTAGVRRRRELPASVRVVGQVILGVLAGERLNTETLVTLLLSLLPVVASVASMLLLSMALAR